MNRLLATLVCVLPAYAFAETVDATGELGCDLVWTQGRRHVLEQAIADAFAERMAGRETPESARQRERNVADLQDLLKAGNCRPLEGRFQVLERRQYLGWSAIKVRVSKTEYLWIAPLR